VTAITYIAKRGVISGHTASMSYNLETSAMDVTPSHSADMSSNITLDGTTESLLNRIDKSYSVSTGWIASSSVDAWWEFIDSVAAAETFTFDAVGTIAVPVNPIIVVLEGKARCSHTAGGIWYRFSFTVREAT